MKIFVQRDGKNYGPYSLTDLRAYLGDGALAPTDAAWHEGMETWAPLGTLEVLAMEAPAPPPVPTQAAVSAIADAAPRPGVSRPERTLGAEEQPAGTAVSLVDALAFPFRQPAWIASMWWIPVASFVPFLGWILLRGWRFEVVRRVGTGASRQLPDGKGIGDYLANGVILAFMLMLYSLPLIIILFFFGFTQIKSILTVAWWALQSLFSDNETETFLSLVLELAVQVATEALLPFVYLLLVYPFYRMAVIRFALTGRPGVFFRPLSNLRLAFRYAKDLLVLFFFDVGIMRMLRWSLNIALAVTGVGLLLIPAISIPAYFWTTGHLFGQVARKVSVTERAAGRAL